MPLAEPFLQACVMDFVFQAKCNQRVVARIVETR